jgi:mannose-1-phosphate guanylyltransferase
MHADHAIEPEHEFVTTVERAVRAAERGSLVCIGAPPDRPETGYGYVELGQASGERTWKARRFVEKPDPATAARYLESGGFLWNTGIFVWRAADFLDAVRELAPEIARALPLLESDGAAAYFREVAAVAVDVAVMERSPNVEVVEASFAWDDVGSWSALGRARDPDAEGNVVIGDGLTLDTRNSVVWAEDGSVALFGVDDLVVVTSGGRTLVTKRSAAPDLKRLVERLRQGGG